MGGRVNARVSEEDVKPLEREGTAQYSEQPDDCWPGWHLIKRWVDEEYVKRLYNENGCHSVS